MLFSCLAQLRFALCYKNCASVTSGKPLKRNARTISQLFAQSHIATQLTPRCSTNASAQFPDYRSATASARFNHSNSPRRPCLLRLSWPHAAPRKNFATSPGIPPAARPR